MLPFENEVLFKSGTKFVVESVGKIRKPGNSFQEMIEIILKEK